jgi:hypothetical protein
LNFDVILLGIGFWMPIDQNVRTPSANGQKIEGVWQAFQGAREQDYIESSGRSRPYPGVSTGRVRQEPGRGLSREGWKEKSKPASVWMVAETAI